MLFNEQQSNNFSITRNMNDIEKITSAVEGLYYISETDHPFELRELDVKEPVEQQLLTMFNHGSGTLVEKQTLDYFFRNMVKTYDAATPDDVSRAERFRKLKDTLNETLNNIEVYRLGDVSIDAVVVGTTKDGKLLSLSTKLVET